MPEARKHRTQFKKPIGIHRRASSALARHLLALMLGTLSVLTLAQEERTREGGGPANIEEVVVTAELRPVPWLTQPASSSVVEADMLARRNAVHLENLLQLTQQHAAISDRKPQTYQLGATVFDPNKYELQIGEDTKSLSHRETELLKILAENTNHAVQRRDILKKIWGDDSFFNSRNLDVYITKLRGYFKEDPSVQIITLKGVGYRFVVDD